MTQISPGTTSMMPNSVQKRSPPCCGTTSSSPSASPAVVMVRMP